MVVKDEKTGILDILLPFAAGIAVVFLANERRVPLVGARRLARFFRSRGFTRFILTDRSLESLTLAMDRSDGYQIVCTGSFYLLALVYRYSSRGN